MKNLIVTPAPHIKETSTPMGDVIIALIPALAAGLWFFGAKALWVIFATTLSAIVFEMICLKLRKMKISPMDIVSAAVTGLLLAFCVSSAMPWWIMVLAAFVSIVIAKHAFGGTGYNIFNPALVGRAFLLTSWPVLMTTWYRPYDAVTGATPLGLLKESKIVTDYAVMFFGNHAGSIGEISAIALLIGALYLLYRKTIDLRIPISYLLTVAIMSVIFRVDPIFNLLAGGLLLGAFYMATDPVTSPVTKPGRWVFGIGCGFITMVIRLWGGYPEGVCYAILVMNAATPLLDRYLQGRIFGKKGWNLL